MPLQTRVAGVSVALLCLLTTRTAVADRPAPPAPVFEIDPVMDAALIAATGAFGGLLQLIIETGEIRPQEPGDPENLLGIDRPTAMKDEPLEASAPTLSNIGLAALLSYGIVDTVLAEVLDRGDALAYTAIYLEALVINFAVTNLAKIAVRRPRPLAYLAAANGEVDPLDTDSSLSFYSGHASAAACLAATATYLSFARGDSPLESWLIFGIGAAATGFVSWQRVRANAHFPTDVIAGAIAGAAVGVIIPHLHRIGSTKRSSVQLSGFVDDRGAGLGVSGRF